MSELRRPQPLVLVSVFALSGPIGSEYIGYVFSAHNEYLRLIDGFAGLLLAVRVLRLDLP